jgi:mannose-6-phosphate isomerase-like protein (cupin superfamily)
LQKVNLKEKFGMFSEQWSPKIIAEVNDTTVKIAKLEGEFEWHTHEAEDELFFVFKGSIDIHTRHEVFTLNEGEILVVPKGVEHMPVAGAEAEVMVIEKNTTVNTGGNVSERTKTSLDYL